MHNFLYASILNAFFELFHVSQKRNSFTFIFAPVEFQSEQFIWGEISAYFHLVNGQVFWVRVGSDLDGESFSVH